MEWENLAQEAAAKPSPIILPDIRYQFSEQIDPSTGEPLAIVLQLWLTSLPLLQIAIPFDRLSFAHFIKAAQDASGGTIKGVTNGGA